MRLHDICLALRITVENFQADNAALKAHGEAFPAWVDDWSDKAHSLVFTNFGRSEAPSAAGPATGLKGRFLRATENRFCRLNYQQTVDTLEKILVRVEAEKGRDKAVSLLAHHWMVRKAGAEFVPALKQAGFKFADEARFAKLLSEAQNRPEPPRYEIAP